MTRPAPARRSPCRRVQAPVIAVAAALILLVASPRPVSAHAYLLRAEPGVDAVVPGAPRVVRLWFSEPIDLTPNSLDVFGPDGRRVSLARVAVAASDATEMVAPVYLARQGTYTVRWKVISADTHPVWGAFLFSIGAPSPVVLPIANAPPLFQNVALALQALARLFNLLSLALLAGPLALWVSTLAPAARRHAPALLLRLWQRTTRLYSWGLIALVVAMPLTIAAQMMSVSDSLVSAVSVDAFAAALSGRLGGLVVLRMALGLVLFVAGAAMAYVGPGRLLRAPRENAAVMPHPLLWLVVAVSALLAVSISLGSHAAVTAPVLFSLLLDVAHLVAMALWAGGLFALVGVLAPSVRRVGPEARSALLAAVIARFSMVALLCVTALTLTGLYSAARNLSGPLDLIATGYGRALGLKLLVSVAVLLVASVNLLVLRPALARVAAGHAQPIDLWPPLRALLRVEALLAAMVLVIVGVLTALPPARQPGGVPLTLQTGGAVLPGCQPSGVSHQRSAISRRPCKPVTQR